MADSKAPAGAAPAAQQPSAQVQQQAAPAKPAPAPASASKPDAKDAKDAKDKDPAAEEPEYVSDEEKRKVEEIKKTHPEVKALFDDRQITIFLLARKGNVERTLQLLENYTVRVN